MNHPSPRPKRRPKAPLADLSMLLDSGSDATCLRYWVGLLASLGLERLRAASDSIEVDQSGDEIGGKIVGDEGGVADRDQQLLLSAHGDVQAVVQTQMTEETACLPSPVLVAGSPVRRHSSDDREEDDVELHALEGVDGSDADLLVVIGDCDRAGASVRSGCGRLGPCRTR